MTASTPPDQQAVSVPDNILRRLQNLLKLADDPAAPAQAATAAGIAAKLMREYDLSVEAARVMRNTAAVGSIKTTRGTGDEQVIARLVLIGGKRIATWIKILVSSISLANHCRTSIVQVEDFEGNLHHTEFMCFGTFDDTLKVQHILKLISDQINLLAGMYVGNRATYRTGAAVAVQERIAEATKAAEEAVHSRVHTALRELSAPNSSHTQAAMVMSQAIARLDRRMEAAKSAQVEAGGSGGGIRGSRASKVPIDMSFMDGYVAGRRLKTQLADELPHTTAAPD